MPSARGPACTGGRNQPLGGGSAGAGGRGGAGPPGCHPIRLHRVLLRLLQHPGGPLWPPWSRLPRASGRCFVGCRSADWPRSEANVLVHLGTKNHPHQLKEPSNPSLPISPRFLIWRAVVPLASCRHRTPAAAKRWRCHALCSKKLFCRYLPVTSTLSDCRMRFDITRHATVRQRRRCGSNRSSTLRSPTPPVCMDQPIAESLPGCA